MTDTAPPAPVLCAGCGDPTPYDAGRGDEFPSFGEWLRSEFGWTYVRTHCVRECVLAARAQLGKPGQYPKTKEEKIAAQRERETATPT